MTRWYEKSPTEHYEQLAPLVFDGRSTFEFPTNPQGRRELMWEFELGIDGAPTDEGEDVRERWNDAGYFDTYS